MCNEHYPLTVPTRGQCGYLKLTLKSITCNLYAHHYCITSCSEKIYLDGIVICYIGPIWIKDNVKNHGVFPSDIVLWLHESYPQSESSRRPRQYEWPIPAKWLKPPNAGNGISKEFCQYIGTTINECLISLMIVPLCVVTNANSWLSHDKGVSDGNVRSIFYAVYNLNDDFCAMNLYTYRTTP